MRIEAEAALSDEDRAAILAFWTRAWAPVVPDIDFVARRPWLSEHLDGLMASGAALLVAREEASGVPLGFLTLDATGTIDQFAVDPVVQGSGCGRALMEEAKRRCPGGLHLRVNQVNARAVAFYRRAGFVITGETVSPRSSLPVWTMDWPAPP